MEPRPFLQVGPTEVGLRDASAPLSVTAAHAGAMLPDRARGLRGAFLLPSKAEAWD
jgi:hypothetical protein